MERKLATILFVDLVDSTELVTGLDPEVARRRVTRYFQRTARCIEEHGGTVEKFAGDAVMAAFGVPLAHEDDAERALRAAFAVLDAVHELELEARVGVESGEVVVEGGDSTFATGEALNLAARLQQSARPGEIRLGPGARRLAAGSVEVEDAGSLELRGREALWTWRALRIIDGARRAIAAPFVGRDRELELLHNTFARAVRDRRAHIVTVFGEPGVGKSRLVSEFTEGIERATVLTGRALPYGEGVTYWPIASMVKASAGITDDDPAGEAFDKLRVCCESEAVADLLAVALGVLGATDGERTSAELQWAALRWAEQLAEAQPLVLVFEDVHWAEEPLLDLIEYVARSLRSAPLLIVSVARPELLELRPVWGGGNVRSTAVELSPLPPAESEQLADALLAADVPAAQRALVLEKAEGNPLFLEETARMLAEGNAERIPDSVQALIAARIDRLEPDEKHVLQCAALIGRVFWRGALDHLCPDLDVGPLLDALLEREFILPEARSTISGDRAFQFKHVLIREVARASMSKEQRAQEHRQFADWIAERAPDELAEIRAYHLDHAVTLLRELDGEAPADLMREAAAALERAGRSALAQESNRTARRLLLSALELEPTLERRYEAARAAKQLGDFPAVAREMEAVRAEAHAARDGRLEGRALSALAEIARQRAGDPEQVAGLAQSALAVLPEDDVEGRFAALMNLYDSAWFPGDLTVAERHLRQALALAEGAGRTGLVAEALMPMAWITYMRLDLVQADRLVERALRLAEESGNAYWCARAWAAVGALRRVQGQLDEAETAYAEARRLYGEVDAARNIAWVDVFVAWIVWIGGDAERAERQVREAIRTLTKVQDYGFLCEAQRALAELMLARGRIDEAEHLALASRETVSPSDLTSRGTTAMTLGLVRAAQGRDDEAEALLREAVGAYEGTDFRLLLCEPATALAEFLLERGRDDEASAILGTLPDPVPGWLGRADVRAAALRAATAPAA